MGSDVKQKDVAKIIRKTEARGAAVCPATGVILSLFGAALADICRKTSTYVAPSEISRGARDMSLARSLFARYLAVFRLMSLAATYACA